MRILIIGGTRFIGPCVAKRLLERGDEVLLFHRRQSQDESSTGVRHLYGDRKMLEDFVPPFARFSPDVVLDMIPSCEEDAHKVMRVFKGLAGRVAGISSQDVYLAWGRLQRTEPGPVERFPLSEQAPLRKRLFPYREKIEGMEDYEKILVERILMGDAEFPGTILRLPMVYGPGDQKHRLFPYLKRMEDRRPAILLEECFARWRWTKGYVENVADAITSAVTEARASGRIFNVGEKEAMTMKEWVKRIGAIRGWDGEVIVVPKDQAPAFLKPDINTEQHIVTDTALIRNELNYQERVSLDEGLSNTIGWERDHPPDEFAGDDFDYEAEDGIIDGLSTMSE